MKIQDGKGQGRFAGVTKDQQLLAQAQMLPLQHFNSRVKGQTYQVVGEATPINGNVTPLFIKNNSADKFMVFSFIRLQAINSASMPAASVYWQMGFDMAYDSGGSLLTPINMNRNSGNSADATCYSNPTLTGSIRPFDEFTWLQRFEGLQGFRPI